MGGLINPYATLGPMMLKDYNTFLKEQVCVCVCMCACVCDIMMMICVNCG